MPLTLVARDHAISPSLGGIHARVRLADGREFSALQAAMGLGNLDAVVGMRESAGPLELAWRWKPDGAGVWLRLEVRNAGPDALVLDRFTPLAIAAPEGRLDLAAPLADWAFYQHGWMSWSPTLIRPVLGSDRLQIPAGDPYYQAHNLPQRPNDLEALSSNDLTLIGTAEQALLLGFERSGGCLNHLDLAIADARFTRLQAVCEPQAGLHLGPGDRFETPGLWIAWGTPEALLAHYAAATSPGLAPESSPAGWCSWYYYFGMNTADDVRNDLHALGTHPQGRALEWVILDDGYQTAIGDWTSIRRDRYPEGLAAIAAQVRAAGKTPGLWLAPFCVGADSRLFAAHPDWVVRDATGAPQVVQRHWNTDVYGLDLSRGDVKAHLRALIETLTRTWDFGVLKLDFLHFAAHPGVRADAGITPLDAYRDGLAAIREAAGPTVHLLGCGAPLMPSLGLVDSMRISQDVGLTWLGETPANMSSVSTRHACMNTVHRLWQHGQWWINDPDCLITRAASEHAPGTAPCTMTEAEKCFLATVVALSGGSMISGDGLSRLDAAEWRRTGQLLPPTGRAARWVRGFKPEWPDVLDLPLETAWEAWHLVGLLNWEDDPRAIALPDLVPGPRWVFDAFAGLPLDAGDTVPLAPHEGKLLAVRPARVHPWLAGDDRHFAQGRFGIESLAWDGEALAIALLPLANPEGNLWIAIPDGFELKAIEGLASDEHASRDGRWLRVAVRVATPRRLRVCFAGAWV
ncbi:MAG TPA: glycoside hydrolase family 36 protein [Oscillatoriaceae cyanobacterium]